jgi:type IV pilus assembly protein PilM
MKKALGQALSRTRGWLAASRTYPIGLHMGKQRLNLVQMREAGAGQPAIRVAAALDYGCPLGEILASPKRLKALVKRAFAGQPFKGRRVVACMPADQVRIQQLNYTAAEGESDAQAIVRELSQRTKGNLDGTVVDFLRVRAEDDSGPQREAIVATAARDQVRAYLDSLSGAGLVVDALDIGPIALQRVVSWIRSPDKEFPPNLLVINFGSVASYLMVVWGRRLMLDRGIDFSEQRLFAIVEKQLDMSRGEAKRLLLAHGFATTAASAEANDIGRTLREVLRAEFAALTAEVNKTLIYTASKTRGRTVDKIYLLGSVARYPGIAGLLGELLSMPVEVLDPFSIFPHHLKHEEVAGLTPQYGVAVAAGLALRNVRQEWPNST